MTALHRVLAVALLTLLLSACSKAGDPLPSWAPGPTRSAILDFVSVVTTPGNPAFRAPEERVAVFDNDGTLWAERPQYFQMYFVTERIRQLGASHPEWQTEEPYSLILSGQEQKVLDQGFRAMSALSATAMRGLTTEEYRSLSAQFVFAGKHPEHGTAYAQLAYQPMLELVRFLEANEFRVYIVSGGNISFIRGFSEELYGIPRERVIGSTMKNKYDGSENTVLRGEKFSLINVGAAKVLNIDEHIGRRPILAVGNSDGDLEMLQYAVGGPAGGMAVVLMHDDGGREYAYTEGAEKVVNLSGQPGWLHVSMAADFSAVFLKQEQR